MNEKRLGEEISEYAKIAKENKNIDVASLIINAMQNQQANQVSGKAKKWSYFISVSLPPVGLLIALRYYFGDQDDAIHVANMCVLLTVITLIGFLLLGKVLISSSGTSVQQIEQINRNDIMQLSE